MNCNNEDILQDSSSDSEENDYEVDGGAASSTRLKRECYRDGISLPGPSSSTKPSVKWPPDPFLLAANTWKNLRPVMPGNPFYGNKMQLFSKSGYNIAVYADGTIHGTKDDSDLHKLMSAGHAGHVRIQGILTKLYIAIDAKGQPYGEPDMMQEGTVFIEDFQGSYNSYLSRKYAHLGWFLGIKKSGKPKKGPKTTYRQKAVHFLPRRSKFQIV